MNDSFSPGEVLVLVAHPDLASSRVNRQLMQAASALGERVAVRDLYALYPDYLIDATAEQEQLAKARLVVWQHPVHWYGLPPLMKLWLDEVLSFGWAYGPGGTALRGKHLWLVASTGGAEESYRPGGHNRHEFDAFLPPVVQTATLCGMRFLKPLLLHGAHSASEAELQQHGVRYAQRLSSHPHWEELAHVAAGAACEVPSSARPGGAPGPLTSQSGAV